MPVTINTGGTYKATRVDNADTATGWAALTISGSGGGAGLLNSVGTIDLVAEGTDARASRTNKQRVKIYYTNALGYDFTSGGTGTGLTKVPLGNAYIWAAFLAAGSALLKANGGMQIALGDGANTSYWNVAGSDTYSGGFIKWAVNTASTPSGNSGTNATLGDITEIGFVTDVGGNTTRFDNFVVDAMEVGAGLSFNGTTDSNALFTEATVQDDTAAIGVMRIEEGIVFTQGSVSFDGTAMTSNGETLVFSDTLGGAYTYGFDVTGTATLTNSSISASGLVDYNFDTTAATAFTMSGGAVSNYATVATKLGQAISGVVFTSGGTAAIANTMASCTFNGCGAITLTGELNKTTVRNSPASAAVIVSDLDFIKFSTFESTGTGHAVELNISTGTDETYTWNSNDSGYAGINGSTGNETIRINMLVAATLTINVVAGATTPTIFNSGLGSFIVSVDKSTLGYTLNPAITNYEYRIYEVTNTGSLAGANEVQGDENATNASQSYAYDFVNGTNYAIQILPKANDFEESVTYYSATAGDQNVIINLKKDINN